MYITISLGLLTVWVVSKTLPKANAAPRAELRHGILIWLLRGHRLKESTDQDPDWRQEGVCRNIKGE